MNPISQVISDAITYVSTMKSAVGVDTKWLDKTLDKLEEAEAYSAKVMHDNGKLMDCICDDAINSHCGVHGYQLTELSERHMVSP